MHFIFLLRLNLFAHSYKNETSPFSCLEEKKKTHSRCSHTDRFVTQDNETERSFASVILNRVTLKIGPKHTADSLLQSEHFDEALYLIKLIALEGSHT